MTAEDIPHGMRLKEQAGWNQTEADWARCLSMQPDGCFLAEKDGSPVGTVVTCVFGSVAWIAMMLVDVAYRRQGIGEALMRHALAFLEERGIRTVRLDATPLGQPLYAKLGFVVEYQLARYRGLLPRADPVPGVEPAREGQLDPIVQFDRAITRTDRSKLLLRLFRDRPEDMRVVQQAGEIQGFVTVRPRARELLIGPCLATPQAGPLLLADAWHRQAGEQIAIDVPTGNQSVVRLAEAKGLTIQRYLVRMCCGEVLDERVQQIWASSGPEKG
jgi:GNAT superfamily N-acetyltransferase